MNNYANTYFGYTDTMQPMKKVRIQNTLDKKYRYSDGVMTCKEHLYKLLQVGSTLKMLEDYSYYSSKTQAMTKPKTEYQIHFIIQDNGKDIAVYNSITKTEYDYCNYIIANGFIDSTKVDQFIIDEQNRIKAEQEAQANTERLQQETEQREIKEQEQFKIWLAEQAAQYNNTAKIELQKQIWLNLIGNYGSHAIELLVLIDNMDKPRCKAELKQWLHLHNKASLKTFEYITGIKLGSTEKEICAILDSVTQDDFKETQEFKPHKKHEQNRQEETFYILYEKHYLECFGIPFSKYGLDLFIREHDKKMIISEARTGLLMSAGKTKVEALEQLDQTMTNFTLEKINQLLEQSISKYGISPKYQEQNTQTITS
jgi:hypothetical protein